MSHQDNIDMHRTRLKSLRSKGHVDYLLGRIEEERKRIINGQERIDVLQHELDHTPELIVSEKKALRHALLKDKRDAFKKEIARLHKLAARIRKAEEEERDAAENT